MRRDRLRTLTVPVQQSYMNDEIGPRGHHRLRIHRYTMRSCAYLVTTTTARRRPLFARDTCARIVATGLDHYHQTGYVHGYAWVVMPDHIHWVLQLRVGTLSSLMQRMKTWTSWQVRKVAVPRPQRVWSPAYHDRRLRVNDELANYIGYIILNPVRRGLVTDPRDYPYLYAESEILDIAGREPEAFQDPLSD